jgi:hypothetical protein
MRAAQLAETRRAGLGIELAEAKKIAGEIARQDREIALHEARRLARGLAAEAAGAHRVADSGGLRIDHAGPVRMARACAGPLDDAHAARRPHTASAARSDSVIPP